MFCEESEQKVTFFFFFLNFDTVFENSTPENFANIFRTELDGISAIEFETARIHFISDVFVAFAIIHPWCRNLIKEQGPGISPSYYECDPQIISIHREKEEFEWRIWVQRLLVILILAKVSKQGQHFFKGNIQSNTSKINIVVGKHKLFEVW